MFRLDSLSKLLADYPPEIKTAVLKLWNLELKYRDLTTQIYFLGQYVPFTLALITVGLGVPRQETEKAIFILEKSGCISCFTGKYQSIIKCQLSPFIVTVKETFRQTHSFKKEKQPTVKNLKLRQLLGVA